MMRSDVPSHLIAALGWEESTMRRDLPPVVEANGTCSKGILQRNGSCSRERDESTELDQSIAFAERWWRASGNDWERTKLAYRRGYL
jgi:hypothetical protein